MCSRQKAQGVTQNYQEALTTEAYWNLLLTFPVIKAKWYVDNKSIAF